LSFYGVLDSQFNPIAISGESNVDWAIDAKFYNAIQKPRFTTAANLTINYIFEFKSDANTTVTSTFRNKITSGKYYYRYRFLANGYSFFTNINVPLVVEND
jgi:hypothetical protein